MNQSNNLVVLRAYGNEFEALQSEVILTTALKELVSQLTMPGLITVDTQDESKKKGQTVQVQCPVVFKEALEHGESSIATDIVELNRPGFPRHSPGSLRNAFQTLPVTADC